MSAHTYPGLFGDPRQGRLWPALVFSVVLHVLLFWSFSRFQIRPDTVLSLPSYTVELSAGMGGAPGRRAAPVRKSEPRPPPPAEEAEEAPPPPPRTERKAPEPERGAKEIPTPEPEPVKPTPKAVEKPAPPLDRKAPAPKTAAPELAPETPAKPLPLDGRREVKAPPPAPEKPPAAPEKSPEARPAPPSAPVQPPQPATRGAHEADAERQVAERIARLQQKREEQSVSARIERLRQEKGQSDEDRVANSIARLRSRIGGAAERAGPAGKDGGGALGPIGVRGGSGNLLQDVRLGVYKESLYEKFKANWSIPSFLERKGYVAEVTIVWNRQGRVTQVTLDKSSGNTLYDQAVMRAIEATSQKGDLAIPREIPADSIEQGFRFRE